jgi:hypothetical protein
MKLRTGLNNSKLEKIVYFRDRLDPEIILDALGIEATGRVGANIQAHCPNIHGLHATDDNNPSWGFHVDKLVFNCFVCGGGTIVDLVEQIKQCDEDAAIDWLRVNSDLEPSTAQEFQEEIERLLMPPELKEEVLPSYSKDSVFQYKYVHPYILDRGISAEVSDKMGVGFDAEHMAIVVPHFFRGQIVGIQRRHLLFKDGGYACPRCGKDSKHIPKYKNTSMFPKKTTLYNYDNIDFSQPVIVVESPMTALYLMSWGHTNVVATFGNFGPQQMVLLIKAPEVWIWPDNDKAGLENLKNSLLILERSTKIFIIPAIPGEKADAADLSSHLIPLYLDQRYPGCLYPMEGLKVYTTDDVEIGG